MIKARHTITGKLVCDFFAGYKLKKTFRAANISGDGSDDDLPVLMLANHFSWWDGFIQYRLNSEVFKRRFHVMMLEEQLTKHPILNKGGAFSIRKKSPDILNSLNYSLELLKQKDNLVLIFPQGRIESIYTGYLKFENGLNYLFNHLENDIQIVFNVNLIDFFSDKRPSLSIYYKKYTCSTPFYDFKEIETDFNKFFTDCKIQQSKV